MNYIIEDNFFSDPNDVREFALKQTFYSKENHPQFKIDSIGIDEFPGHRTAFFDDIHSKFYNDIHNKIIPLISKLENIKHPTDKYEKCLLIISIASDLPPARAYFSAKPSASSTICSMLFLIKSKAILRCLKQAK